MAKAKSAGIIPIERIAAQIYLIRGEQVMLDSDLAALYGVSTGRLNEQVTRNEIRFPEDFMFRLTRKEYEALRSQIATLKTGRGQHRKYTSRVFTEHGVAMLSAVLRSQQAIDVSLAIVRAFVRLREMLATNEELASKVAQHDQEMTSSSSTSRGCWNRRSRKREARSDLSIRRPKNKRSAYCP
ncbi:MAG: ORF6N domain-containing protein [Acidobacteria bacterium]|nr:ORF6N domain-containing protein [Acidobacteriota bacterium]